MPGVNGVSPGAFCRNIPYFLGQWRLSWMKVFFYDFGHRFRAREEIDARDDYQLGAMGNTRFAARGYTISITIQSGSVASIELRRAARERWRDWKCRPGVKGPPNDQRNGNKLMARRPTPAHASPGRSDFTMMRFGRLEDMDRSFDLEYWQRQGDAAIFRAAWELVESYCRDRGMNPDELRLQRSVEAFQRP